MPGTDDVSCGSAGIRTTSLKTAVQVLDAPPEKRSSSFSSCILCVDLRLSVQITKVSLYRLRCEVPAFSVYTEGDAQASAMRTGIGGWFPSLGWQDRCLEFLLINVGDPRRRLSLGGRKGQQTFTDYFDARNTCSSCSA